jgi:hypothetical protein
MPIGDRKGGVIRPGYDPLLVPNAPTIGTATAGDAEATVPFTAPTNVGGGSITSYTVISSPDNITASGTTSPIAVTGLTNDTAYTFTVVANNAYGPSAASAASNSVTPEIVQGQQAYTSAGTYSWVAPEGVTSVSVVAVGPGYRGGGGLGYKNNYAVTAGNSYTVVVGNQYRFGDNGSPQLPSNSYFVATCVVMGRTGVDTTAGGTYVGDGGGNGGANNGTQVGAGGGAGGYSGNGGNGGGFTGTGGGGGGGRTGSPSSKGGGGGGGVGILGEGSSGAGGLGTGGAGQGGSGGASGSNGYQEVVCLCGNIYVFCRGGNGGSYGGGAGLCTSGIAGGTAGLGAVRIIWPGATRQFPSTNTGDV